MRHGRRDHLFLRVRSSQARSGRVGMAAAVAVVVVGVVVVVVVVVLRFSSVNEASHHICEHKHVSHRNRSLSTKCTVVIRTDHTHNIYIYIYIIYIYIYLFFPSFLLL